MHPESSPGIVTIPPPIWLLAMALIAFGLEMNFSYADSTVAQSIPAGIGFIVAGIALAIWAERLFALAGTEVIPASPANKALVTEGPYRFTRNPMYLGLIIAAFGIALLFGTVAFYAVPAALFLLVNFIFVPFEEAKMARQFGSRYSDYRARVRRWI